MRQFLVILFISFFINLLADWDPVDPAKWVQMPDPDPTGLDVSLDWPLILADDFSCSETGPITEIHIWCSYFDDMYPPVDPQFLIQIHADIPAAQSPTGYSMPGDILWWSNDHSSTSRIYFEGFEGWFDPINGVYIPDSDFYCWQFNLGPFLDPFIQQGSPAAPTVYWLSIQLLNEIDPYLVGWKTSLDHWNDDAVWDFPATRQIWNELRYPLGHPFEGQSIDLAFVIEGDETTPVELSSFTAIFGEGTPVLNWTTQSESNNMGWNIFRSETEYLEDCFQINSDLIPGAGTSSTPTDYEFTDEYEVEPTLTYWYWIESVNNLGYTETYGPITLTIPEEGYDPGTPGIPDIYGLHQNYPNPFNPNTRISYMMPEDCTGTLTIYDIKGQEVITLFRDQFLGQDEKLYSDWDSRDSTGNPVTSGVYIYELKTDIGTYSRKMVLAK